jgi:hypothetical protein
VEIEVSAGLAGLFWHSAGLPCAAWLSRCPPNPITLEVDFHQYRNLGRADEMIGVAHPSLKITFAVCAKDIVW